jgi:predicted anti-sigma-YlaC factor YlaD
MLCDDFRKALTEGRAEENPSLRAQLDEHAKGCGPCADFSAKLAEISRVARTIPTKIEPPPWMADRVLEIGRQAIARREADARASRAGLGRMLLAASLLIVIGAGAYGLGRHSVEDDPGAGGGTAGWHKTEESLEEMLARFQAIEQEGGPEAIEARLGEARCLLMLGRKAESQAKARAVADDPLATRAQKELAGWFVR